MSVIPGMEDMKPRKVIGFTGNGRALVAIEDGDVREFELFMDFKGVIRGKAVPVEPPAGVDQDTKQKAPKRVPVAERWASTDQAEVLKS